VNPTGNASRAQREAIETKLQPKRALGLFDSTMIVIGVMIGSGIFIVPAGMGRLLGGPGWLLLAWVFTAILTVAAAFSFGELASMMPGAGGMYLYLREAYSPLWGFLYGWTLFTVIQTGTIAAVAVAFARFLGVLAPSISENHYLVRPVHLSGHYAITLSSAQLVALLVIALLTLSNSFGVEYGKVIQNLFTVAKIGALLALILVGLTVGWNGGAVHANLAGFWNQPPVEHPGAFLSLLVVFCVSQSGSLFSADSWHDVTFAADEVKDPRTTLPRSLAIGTVVVVLLYLAANVAFLAVLPFPAIQHASHDRVATAMLQQIFPAWGAQALAVVIMISTFGCINSLVLSGPRAYYAMARDRLFFPAAGRLNRARVPGWSLLMQGVWAGLLVLLTTYSPRNGYGNLYSDLLDYIVSAALLFYILTIAAVIRLRSKRPHAERPYRTPGYPVVPFIYLVGAGTVVLCLFVNRPATTWPGLALVIAGLPIYAAIRRRKPVHEAKA
jgi:basic amino acid/polyamine antiporter, APA family